MNNDIDHLSIPTTITSEYKTGKRPKKIKRLRRRKRKNQKLP